MNLDPKVNLLIKKIKKCEKINDDLYNYIYQEYNKWIKIRNDDWEEIYFDNWWYYQKEFLFYESLYINSTCLRTLFNQDTFKIFNKNDQNFNVLINKSTRRLLRRWYNLKDQQTSKEIKIINQESQKKCSYLFLLSNDIIRLLNQYL